MDMPLDFEWDDAKAEANLTKHGVSFEIAVAVFADPDRADFDASRSEEGEVRRKTVGKIQGRLFTVVYTIRADVCRIISARRANAKESRNYGNYSPPTRSE